MNFNSGFNPEMNIGAMPAPTSTQAAPTQPAQPGFFDGMAPEDKEKFFKDILGLQNAQQMMGRADALRKGVKQYGGSPAGAALGNLGNVFREGAAAFTDYKANQALNDPSVFNGAGMQKLMGQNFGQDQSPLAMALRQLKR